MIIDEKKMANYADYILEHEYKEELINRITLKIVSSFRAGNMEQRLAASALQDSIDLVFTELQVISDTHKSVNKTERTE